MTLSEEDVAKYFIVAPEANNTTIRIDLSNNLKTTNNIQLKEHALVTGKKDSYFGIDN